MDATQKKPFFHSSKMKPLTKGLECASMRLGNTISEKEKGGVSCGSRELDAPKEPVSKRSRKLGDYWKHRNLGEG